MLPIPDPIECVMVCRSTGVIHRAMIWPWTKRAATACGQTMASDFSGLDHEGQCTEEYALWLTEANQRPFVLCSHCRDREPVWEKWKRRAKKEKTP
jgi:hypothetical protein